MRKLLPQPQKEIRWHIAQIIPRLKLTNKEKEYCVDFLMNHYLHDNSSIVKTNTLQALFELANTDVCLITKIKAILQQSAATGTPAMRSRCKKLLQQLT